MEDMASAIHITDTVDMALEDMEATVAMEAMVAFMAKLKR
jgi:hypothetical protein